MRHVKSPIDTEAVDLDPKKMIYFATVVEMGSINRAAQHFTISQPAMSSSMDRLEAGLGVKLLERGPAGITATSSGEVLYGHARIIRDEVARAKRDLLFPPTPGAEALRIGTLPSLASGIVPAALSQWRKFYPKTDFQIIENAQFDLLTGLFRRDFDFIIGFTEVFDILDGLRQKVLFRDKLYAVVRPDHPLTINEMITWSDLLAYPWVSPTSHQKHTVLHQVLSNLNRPAPDQITVCGTISLLKNLVAETDHIALLPKHAVVDDLKHGRLFTLSFDSPLFNRDIAVFFREGYQMDEPRKDIIAIVKSLGQDFQFGQQ